MMYFGSLMGDDCGKLMPQKPAQSKAIEQSKQEYENDVSNQLERYFSYVLFPSIVSDNNTYLVVYDLHKVTCDKLNQFIGAADFFKFSALFRKYANYHGWKPYFSKHFAINHTKNQVLCLNGFKLDEKKFYELIEKYYNLKVSNEDRRLDVNFPFVPNSYGYYEEESIAAPQGGIGSFQGPVPPIQRPYVPPGFGYGNPFGYYQGPYVPPGFGLINTMPYAPGFNYGNPFGCPIGYGTIMTPYK